MKRLYQRLRKFFIGVLGDIYVKRSTKRARKRLKNHDFSIICNTCIGGVIYHKLGKRFDSPTVNLWISQPDFIKFAFNLKEYLASEFVDIGRRESDNSPMAELDGPEGVIKVCFNHYKTFEEGVAKFKERAQRIHWDNMYFIMSDGNGLTDDDIVRFGQLECNNKVLFTAKQYPYDYTLRLKGYENRDNAAAHMIIKHRIIRKKYVWEDTFDYVEFLNKVK